MKLFQDQIDDKNIRIKQVLTLLDAQPEITDEEFEEWIKK